MPLSEYYSSCALVGAAVVTLLLLPAEYLVSEPQAARAPEEPAPPRGQAPPPAPRPWGGLASTHVPPLDLFFTFTLIAVTFVIYLFEWIQRKIMERRIVKLNQYLGSSVDRLQEWDDRQDQVETTLQLARNATAEYNLLLYLLLRQHRASTPDTTQPPNCFDEKPHDDDFPFLKSCSINTPL